MTTTYEIPLAAQPQTLSATFPNGQTYQLRLIYQFNADDCWILDISDNLGNPLLQGVPLVTGADMLAQYAYLGFGCKMFCATDGAPDTPPKWWNLGQTAHLYIEA